MSSIDNRIVQMEFDNSQFERGVKTTMNSLQSLDDQIVSMGKGGALAGITDGVESLADRFSTLGIVGMSIVENLTDRIVNLGIQMVKSVTVDQIAEGMQKYESITTNTLALVNQADISYEKAAEYIEKLAWYSDATSFNLSNMVSGLQAFARQGIDLDKAIPTIMGIGNSVTYAGQSAKEGSRAFDIYASALAKGGLSLMEWRRLGILNVSTAKLKEQFLEAAVAVGTLRKESEGTYKVVDGLGKDTIVTFENFERTLTGQKGGWASVDVINKVFGEYYGKYTNELADATLEYQKQNGVVLTLDEAMEKLGDQSNKLGKIYLQSATKARTFTEAVDAAKDATSTAFYQIAQAIFGTPEEAIELWTELNDFLVTNFSQPIVDLANIFSGWHDEGGRDEFIQAIKDIYNAVKTYLEPIAEIIDSIIPDLSTDALLEFTHKFAEFARGLLPTESGEAIENENAYTIYNNALDQIAAEEEALREKLQAILGHNYDKYESYIPNLIADLFPNPGDNQEKAEAYIAEYLEDIEAAAQLQERLEELASHSNQKAESFIPDLPIDTNIWTNNPHNQQKAEEIAEAFYAAQEEASEFVEKMSRQERIANVINGIANALNALKEALTTIAQPFKKLGEPLRYFADGMLTVASNLGLYVTNATEGGKVTEWITDRLGPLNKVIEWIGNAIKKLTDFLVGLSEGKMARVFDTITNFLKNFRPFESLARGLGSIFKNIADGIIYFGKAIGSGLNNAIGGDGIGGGLMGKILAWLLTLRTGIEALHDIQFKTPDGLSGGGVLIKILGNISEMFVDLSDILEGFVKKVRVETFKSVATSLLLMAASMLILSSISWEGVAKGIIGLGSCLTMMMVAIRKMPADFKRMNPVGVVGFAAGILLLALSLKSIASIDSDKIKESILALTVVLLEMLTLSLTAGKYGNAENHLKGLFGVAAAVLLLSASIALLGNIKRDKVIQGGIAVTGILGVLTLFSLAMSKIDTSGMLGTAAALVLVAAAIDIMAVGMAVLGMMSWGGIARGLVGIAGVLLEIWAFTTLMKDKGKDMAIIGAALLEISAAMLIISAAMLVMGTIGWEGLQNGFLAFGIILGEIGIFTAILADMGPKMVVLGAALVVFAAALVVFAAALTILSAIGLPGITAAVIGVAEALLVFAGLSLVLTALWPVMLVGAGVILALSAALIVLGVAFEKIAIAALIWNVAMGKTSADTVTAAKNMSSGMEQSESSMSTSLNNLLSNTGVFGEKMGQIFEGTSTNILGEVDMTAASLDTKSLGIENNMSVSWKSIGSMMVEGLKNGLKAKWQSALNWMADLGNQMTQTYQGTMGIYSPSRVFMQFGEYIDEGLIIGLQNYAGKVEKSTTNLGNQVINAFSKPMQQVAALAESDLSIKPKITPVIDASNIQNGQRLLNSMFSNGNLTTSIGGVVNPNASALGMISSEIAQLKAQMASMNSRQINEQTLATILTAAMRNVDINMDGTKVGKIVTNYQNQSNRASGW